jgi:hypothetical protein
MPSGRLRRRLPPQPEKIVDQTMGDSHKITRKANFSPLLQF